MPYLISMLLLLAASAGAEVVIETVPVGNPGNACEVQGELCVGGVDYPYEIGKYEVTNAQYAEFLNAVAADDPNGVFYDGSDIVRSGTSGGYSYAVTSGLDARPTRHGDFASALRFANWLHNDQPTGAQGPTTTEDGAYTLAGPLLDVTRNAHAKFVIPSRDEWYKAAYADGSGGWYDYPAGTDAQTLCAAPGAAPNTANCDFAAGGTSDVGAYTASPSPSGTFDQGGNALEWNETRKWRGPGIADRYRPGGYYLGPASGLAAASGGSAAPSARVGFRIAPITSPVVIQLKQVGGTYVPAAGARVGDTLVLDVGYTIHGSGADVTVILPAIAFDPAFAIFQGGATSGPAIWSGGASALADSRPDFVVHDAGALHFVSGLGKVASGAPANEPCVFGACGTLGTLTFELTGVAGSFESGAVQVPTAFGTRVDSSGGDLLAESRLGRLAIPSYPDGDGDGVPDPIDNCSDVPNASQLDGNQNGFGNVCDCDFSVASGACDGGDFAHLVGVFGTTVPPTNCQFDMSPNGAVDGADFGVFVRYYGGLPGPACGNAPGAGCGFAGTPCPGSP